MTESASETEPRPNAPRQVEKEPPSPTPEPAPERLFEARGSDLGLAVPGARRMTKMTKIAGASWFVVAFASCLLFAGRARAQTPDEEIRLGGRIYVYAGLGATCVPADSVSLGAHRGVSIESRSPELCMSALFSSPETSFSILVRRDGRTERRWVTVRESPIAWLPLLLSLVTGLLFALLAARVLRPSVRFVAIPLGSGTRGYREPDRQRVEIVPLPIGRAVDLGTLHPSLEGFDLEILVQRWGVELKDEAVALEARAGAAYATDAGAVVPPGTVVAKGSHRVALLSPREARRAARDASHIRWPDLEAVKSCEENGPWFLVSVGTPSLSPAIVGTVAAGVAAAMVLQRVAQVPAMDLVLVHCLIGPLVAAAVAFGSGALFAPRAKADTQTSGPSRARRI